jgi:hypothetical protein
MVINWRLEIHESRDTDRYRKTVESFVGPAMDYLCKRLNEKNLSNFEKTDDLFKEIFDEMPIMNFKRRNDYNQHYKGPDFFIQYNSYTDIYFEDSSNCIRREIILENLFKDDEKI